MWQASGIVLAQPLSAPTVIAALDFSSKSSLVSVSGMVLDLLTSCRTAPDALGIQLEMQSSERMIVAAVLLTEISHSIILRMYMRSKRHLTALLIAGILRHIGCGWCHDEHAECITAIVRVEVQLIQKLIVQIQVCHAGRLCSTLAAV